MGDQSVCGSEMRQLIIASLHKRGTGHGAFNIGPTGHVQPLHIVGQLLVRLVDELRERGAREVAVVVVDCLDACAIHGQKLPPEQVELAA